VQGPPASRRQVIKTLAQGVKMRLRLVVSDGEEKIDLIWLEHTGKDIYYGFVGNPSKMTYHESGYRHYKTKDGELEKFTPDQPLSEFKGQRQLCSFLFNPKSANDKKVGKNFTGKKADTVVYLDARTLPSIIGVTLGLIDNISLNSLLSPSRIKDIDMKQVHLITNVEPWIFVTIHGMKNELRGNF